MVKVLAGTPASEATLESLEQSIGVRLPSEYRSFLAKQGGGRPRPGGFDYDDGRSGSAIRKFFSAEPGNDESIAEAIEIYAGRVPAGILPIAEDGCGNLVSIGLAGPGRGKVFFWDHEQEEQGSEGLFQVADDFREFLNSLHEPEIPGLFSARIFEDVSGGDIEAVRRFLRAGGNPNVEDDNGRTLIMNAAIYGHSDIVTHLASVGAELEGALSLAAKNGKEELVSIMIDLGADVNERSDSDPMGRPPLFLAATNGYRSAVEVLLANGANPRCKDNRGISVEEALERRGKSEMIEIIRSASERG